VSGCRACDPRSEHRHRSLGRALLATATLFAGVCAAQPDDAPASRPRIGIALAGGGAKGAAHIGVLRVLDELRIPVACVAGTSMGALVGGVYAAGTPPEEIERAVRAIDWARTVGSEGRRDRLPIQRKLASLNYSNSLEIGLRNRQLRMPGGLVGTQEIEQVIRALVAGARSTSDFDELPIPFRAIATDMQAAEMVVLQDGDLATALRASMAIPGAFAPVTIEDRILSDGGMMRNLPVDIARGLCADVVIAVWMSTPPPEAERLTSAVSLVQRSLEVMISANERAQIESLTGADVAIEVPMGDIGTSDFQRVPEAIELGRAAAEAQRDSLRRFSVPEDEYRAWTASLRRDRETRILADVQIAAMERVNPEFVRAQLEHAVPGAAPSVEEIASDVERVYALGDFERVEYALTGPAHRRVLEITPVEKPWGPNFFHVDFGVSTYEGGDILAILRLDHERTWINERGSQWHSALQLGRQTVVTTDFYRPFDTNQRFFMQPIALAREDFEDVYLAGQRVVRYAVREAYGQLDLGVNVGTRAQLRLGVRSGEHEAKLDTGIPGLPEAPRTADTTVQFRALYDTRDSIALPTRGSFLNARYVQSTEWFGGVEDYSLFEAVYTKSFDVRGGDSLSLIFGGANRLSGDVPISQQIELGGIRTFPGLRPGELRGNKYWFAGTAYSWRLVELQPLFGQALYAGVRLQAARMSERFDAEPDGTLYGLAGTVGGRTPIGPFLLSLGFVDEGSWQLQFTLGRPIAEGSLLDQVQ
jgi:NTE family protein